ncbi:uncharacterized protein B0H18DRAFT_926645 [Fomitopsis serialis]|uniref:uncharacterized protein n=1 Tax=Fomitopsis serialis TaxID=139415 RepID=UPI00200894CC|nr:uncharacterized protein B0H18DRAFT_932617 [Neoantrodia serialis]XP_047899965.1 uncharacterized protein B0H18DRAFT_926645 [Neoantrodia serialis]KAH9927320.1 hypothetical protein B0H18DRAFT_932617 [Neoantrodia serialis]KAH9936601.1 hypothetical protein B0H18DRAFT_926645 [Neoantrodia serialis]
MSDVDIAAHVMDHFDKESYGITVWTIRRRRKAWGIRSTCKQGHTVESIHTHVQAIKKQFPNMGADRLRKVLRHNEKIRVSKPVVLEYLRLTEPEAVAARRFRKFTRRQFVAAGVHDMWCIDQHEKLKRHGLFWHVGLDPFPGVTHWCRVWWTVKNPTLITRYHLDAGRKLQGIPLTTQSDPGTENFGVAYAQTALRHRLDAALSGSIQHRFFRKHGNIKPEIFWSLFRRSFISGFEQMIDDGVEQGWYDIGDPLEMLTFRYVFIPYLQRETDAWVHLQNWTKRRADRKKVLPNGIPMLVMQKPHKFNAADYKARLIPVSDELFDEIEAIYAPRDDPVFKLVPDEFALRANAVWTAIGRPEPQFDTAWDIYRRILAGLRSMPADVAFQNMLDETSDTQQAHHTPEESGYEMCMPANLDVPFARQCIGDVVIPSEQVEQSDAESEADLFVDISDTEAVDDSDSHGIGLDFF